MGAPGGELEWVLVFSRSLSLSLMCICVREEGRGSSGGELEWVEISLSLFVWVHARTKHVDGWVGRSQLWRIR